MIILPLWGVGRVIVWLSECLKSTMSMVFDVTQSFVSACSHQPSVDALSAKLVLANISNFYTTQDLICIAHPNEYFSAKFPLIWLVRYFENSPREFMFLWD